MRVLNALLVVVVAGLLGPSLRAQDLAAKSREGKELLATGRFAEAVPVYRALVKALPANPGPLMNLALALHMSGQQAEAATQFRNVLKLDPRNRPARLFLGVAYLEMKKPAEATAPLAAVVAAEPDNKDARLALGQAYLMLERYESARGQFEQLSTLDPGNAKAWNGLGLSYEGLARKSFAALEKKAPGSPYWLFLVAESRATVGAYTRAFLLYREAEAAMPEMRGIHSAVADIYRKTGNAEWAEVEERKESRLALPGCGAGSHRPELAARFQPTDNGTFECYFYQSRYRQVVEAAPRTATTSSLFWRVRAYNELARAAFVRLAELPPSAEVHELLAEIAYNRRKYAESAQEWEAALKFAPANRYYRVRLAIALASGNQYERAQEILESLLRESPSSPELNFWLGFTLLGLLQPDAAIPCLEKAVQAEPGKLLAQKELGRAFVLAGRYQDAIPHLKLALSADDDGGAHYQLSQAYNKTGQGRLAAAMLQKFKEIESSRGGQQAEGQPAGITPP